MTNGNGNNQTVEDTYNNLKQQMQQFREQIMADMIMGRVQYEIDAAIKSIDTVISSLVWEEDSNRVTMPIKTKRFKAYSRPLTAIKVGTNDIDVGSDFDMPGVKMSWNGATASYQYWGGTKYLIPIPEMTFDVTTIEDIIKRGLNLSDNINIYIVSDTEINGVEPDVEDARYKYYFPDEVSNYGLWGATLEGWYEQTIYFEWKSMALGLGEKATFRVICGNMRSFAWDFGGSAAGVMALLDGWAIVVYEEYSEELGDYVPKSAKISIPIAMIAFKNVSADITFIFGDRVTYTLTSGQSPVLVYAPNYTTFEGFVPVADTINWDYVGPDICKESEGAPPGGGGPA